MLRLLGRRILREIKANFFRYLALFSLIVFGMYLVVSLVGSAETVIRGVDEKSEEQGLEDGEFTVLWPLDEEQEETIREGGIVLERLFHLDFRLFDDSTVRVFQNRKDVNLAGLEEGQEASAAGEVVLEKRYADEHGLSVGSKFVVAGTSLIVAGIGTVPDYDAVLQGMSDTSVDSRRFGLAFVSERQYQELKLSGCALKAEEYTYAFRLEGTMTGGELVSFLNQQSVSRNGVERKNLTQFIEAEDNPRIKASAKDQVITKAAGLLAGIIILTLFTYVISVFVIHGIEQESGVIGALYALGVKRSELLAHYLALPVLVTMAAGILGTWIGFSRHGMYVQMKDILNYFSVPKLEPAYPAYLIMYGIVMPPIVAGIVNYFVIRGKLSQTALSLLRRERQRQKVWNVRLGKMGFVTRFGIRQMLREARSGLTVILGMFLSLLVLMMGVDCLVMCMNYARENKQDVRFEYMYLFQYPESMAPERETVGYARNLSKEQHGYELDVTLLGIEPDNPYFDADVGGGKDKVVISSSVAYKYNLKRGDTLVLMGERAAFQDKEARARYEFIVEDITQYSIGLYVFMELGDMRELFGSDETFYNVVFSDRELEIDRDRLYAVTEKKDIWNSSDVFIRKMKPLIVMLITASILIFCVVLSLMLMVMVDRSGFGISLFRVFGYRQSEIRRLYLNGNLCFVVLGALLCMPLSKGIMDFLYPFLIANIGGGMNLAFSWKLYLLIFAAQIGLYGMISLLLSVKLKKITPADVLKNRD